MGQTKIKYAGNVPEASDVALDLTGWKLYRLRKKTEQFENYKLVSTIPRDKANYYLSMNLSTGRMVNHRDVRSLRKNQPRLYRKVMIFLEGVRK